MHGGGKPFLVQTPTQGSYAIDGEMRRQVKAGMLFAALTRVLGAPRDVSDQDLERWSPGPPVEVLESDSGPAFLVIGGRRLPLRGLPLPYLVSNQDMLLFPEGEELNVAASAAWFRRHAAPAPARCCRKRDRYEALPRWRGQRCAGSPRRSASVQDRGGRTRTAPCSGARCRPPTAAEPPAPDASPASARRDRSSRSMTTRMPQAALIAESFGTNLRYSGAGIGYQLASVIAGGPAPLIAAAILEKTKSSIGISWYIIGCCVLSMVALVLMPRTQLRQDEAARSEAARGERRGAAVRERQAGPVTDPRTLTRAHFDHVVPATTRWSDNDMYGHLNNAVYYELFDSAINGWLITGAGADVLALPELGVVAESGCRFFRELEYPGLLDVGRSGRASGQEQHHVCARAVRRRAGRPGRRRALGPRLHRPHVSLPRADPRGGARAPRNG